MAELADALDSGSSARKGVGVQIPPSAPSPCFFPPTIAAPAEWNRRGTPAHRLSRVSRTAAWRAARGKDGVPSSRQTRRSNLRTRGARTAHPAARRSDFPRAEILQRTFAAAPGGPSRTQSGQISPSRVSPSKSRMPRRRTANRAPQQTHSCAGYPGSAVDGGDRTIRSMDGVRMRIVIPAIRKESGPSPGTRFRRCSAKRGFLPTPRRGGARREGPFPRGSARSGS